MKPSILLSALLSLFLSTSVSAAKGKEYKGMMHITPLYLEQRGDSLYIGIDFDIQGVNVDFERSISLIPVLVGPDRQKNLPEVMVKGRANYHTSLRALALMSKAERKLYDLNPPYAIVKGYKSKDRKQINYRKVIPFESWMKDARLDIQEDLCGCGNPPRSLAVSPLVNCVQMEQIIVIEPYQIAPHLSYIQPKAEAIKKREIQGEAFIDFVVNKIDIRPDYLNNPRELKKITDMMEEVRNDKDITVKGIFVIGYASPEGTYTGNQRLSQGRANALVDYLAPLFDYPKNMYKVVFGGENWSGLLENVTASQMPDKDEILSILTDSTIQDERRKVLLQRLKGGQPYQQMLKEYYPHLRKAICKMDYEVRGFEIAEAREIIKSRPQNLSLNEMFLVANTYEPGSFEFTEIFETAVRLFPEDETANLNAAMAALSRKDIVSAERYLVRVKSGVPMTDYNNAMGILSLLKGDYPAAEKHLQSAASGGSESARLNLKELQKKLENIALIETINLKRNK